MAEGAEDGTEDSGGGKNEGGDRMKDEMKTDERPARGDGGESGNEGQK